MDHVVGWLFLAFWVVLGGAVVVRLVLALRQRRRGSSLQESVLRPVLRTGTAGVWPTLDARAGEHPEDVPEGAEPRNEAEDQHHDQAEGQSRE
ncbi:hypothetical protein LTH96_02400 [Nesterenkonia sp. LB17]|uniref:hypothetical protein n=1 Tax=Nesterenkonia sp. LB17 TaxID=2901230 RepID=UPI001F4CD4C9|nr:hypothetical protein [Nesterenkonia sp. LB17]MCH8564592.1 hypothetical protein [Nesterenkonia sp. LB17]